MDAFFLFFKIGVQHIASFNSTDHLLFIIALSIRYQFSDWKQLLVLITAFTIGHSVSLALSVFRMVHFTAAFIELIIPLTIIITAIINLRLKQFSFKKRESFLYFLALFFGLIHGLGFSNYLNSMLGRNETVFLKLFAFNTGLEVGQLLILASVLVFSFVCLSLLKFDRREYVLLVNGGIIALAIRLMM